MACIPTQAQKLYAQRAYGVILSIVTTKECAKCLEFKDLSSFPVNGHRKCKSLMRICRQCENNRITAWKQANREKYNSVQVEGGKRRIQLGFCKHCREPLMPHSEKFCEKHWFIASATRNLGQGTLASGKALHEKLIEQNYECPYTGERLIPGLNAHLDHIKPKHRFPESKNLLENVEWVSETANLAKRAMTKDEFIQFCKLVSARFPEL